MANTDKHNFKCDTDTRWDPALTKVQQMREAGYDIDMTYVLNAAVIQFRDETDEQTAKRLKLVKGDGPAKPYRAPRPRTIPAPRRRKAGA